MVEIFALFQNSGAVILTNGLVHEHFPWGKYKLIARCVHIHPFIAVDLMVSETDDGTWRSNGRQ
jgi:hypothetical protein